MDSELVRILFYTLTVTIGIIFAIWRWDSFRYERREKRLVEKIDRIEDRLIRLVQRDQLLTIKITQSIVSLSSSMKILSRNQTAHTKRSASWVEEIQEGSNQLKIGLIHLFRSVKEVSGQNKETIRIMRSVQVQFQELFSSIRDLENCIETQSQSQEQ